MVLQLLKLGVTDLVRGWCLGSVGERWGGRLHWCGTVDCRLLSAGSRAPDTCRHIHRQPGWGGATVWWCNDLKSMQTSPSWA